jgi:hypothetical protein
MLDPPPPFIDERCLVGSADSAQQSQKLRSRHAEPRAGGLATPFLRGQWQVDKTHI